MCHDILLCTQLLLQEEVAAALMAALGAQVPGGIEDMFPMRPSQVASSSGPPAEGEEGECDFGSVQAALRYVTAPMRGPSQVQLGQRVSLEKEECGLGRCMRKLQHLVCTSCADMVHHVLTGTHLRYPNVCAVLAAWSTLFQRLCHTHKGTLSPVTGQSRPSTRVGSSADEGQ